MAVPPCSDLSYGCSGVKRRETKTKDQQSQNLKLENPSHGETLRHVICGNVYSMSLATSLSLSLLPARQSHSVAVPQDA